MKLPITAAATGASDVVWLADAVAAGGQVTPSEVRIALRHKADLLESPQTYVTAAAGFTQLLPGGTVLRIAGVDELGLLAETIHQLTEGSP